MRLIDADALKEALFGIHIHDGMGLGMMVRVDDLEPVIDGMPTIEAWPIVLHGRWVEYPECLEYDGAMCDDHIMCSYCKAVWNIIDNDTERFDYCPHCGAKMEVENDG